MLNVDQKKRYTLEDVMLHPWIHKEKNELISKELIEAFNRLKLFDANRKLKAAMVAVRGAIRMHICKKRKRALVDLAEREDRIANGDDGDNEGAAKVRKTAGGDDAVDVTDEGDDHKEWRSV
jgi:hypothetical protein